MIKPTLLDRAIASVAPVHAARRLHARASIAAFEAFSGAGSDGAGLSPSNSGGRWISVPRDANSDTLRGLPRQRAESRDLVSTNPIAAGAIKTNVDRIVGTGLVPVPEPDRHVLGWSEDQAAEWKAGWQRECSLWMDSLECTLDASGNFFDWQALVLRSRLESGDCFTVLPDGEPTSTQPYRLRLQLIEADRCGNPNGAQDTAQVVAGVRRDGATGRSTSFHIYDRHPNATSAVARAASSYAGRWIDAVGPSGRRRILHHMRPRRPEQTRGLVYLAPVIQTIKDLGRYSEAEITAAVISAFFTVFIETNGAASPAPVFGAGPSDTTGSAPADDANIELAPGAVVGLGKGEKASMVNPARPNPNADAFLMGMLKLVGVGLGLPFELLIKQFQSSYSASKAALLDAWFHFRTERGWLVANACQPVYETLMAEAVAARRIAAPGFFTDPLMRWAYTRAAWHGDSQGSINPKDEVEAYRSAVDGRLMTNERAEWELFGTDWGRTYEVKLREHRMLQRDGMTPAPKAGAPAPSPAPAPAAATESAPIAEATA